MKRWMIAIGLLLSTTLGIGFQLAFGDPGGLTGWNVFKAFTVQSNIWITLMVLILVIYQSRHPNEQLPKYLIILKFMTTAAILLTYIVFAVLLSPFVTFNYLISPTNLFLHVVTPMLAVIDFILFDSLLYTKKSVVYSALVLPFIYAVIFEITYVITDSLPVPYFFLDYQQLGWFLVTPDGIGIAYWMIIILGIILGIACGLYKLATLFLLPKHRINSMNIAVFTMVLITVISIVVHL